MKIRTQLIASTALATLATGVAGFAVWFAVMAERSAHDEQRLAQEASRETANLLVLTQEYALHFEERAAQQWRERQSALAFVLSKGRATPTLSDLRNANAGLPQVFERLSELPGAPDTPLTASRQEFLVDQVLTGAQVLADGAYRWSREAAVAQAAAERRYQRWGLAAFASLVVLLLAQTAFLTRRVLQPIARLEKAAAAVERGQFDTRLDVQRKDEIGDLKRAFNAMTEALAQRTAALDREMALHSAAESRMRSIIANAPDAFIGIDERGCITEWNHRAEVTFGWAREEVLGRLLGEVIIPPAQRAAHAAGMKRFIHLGTGPVINNRIEVTALHRDGHEIPVELSVAALRQDKGYIANAFLHNISKRLEAQAQLAAGEKRLRDITDTIPALISYIDRNLRLQFANETFREWIGVDPQASVGRPLEDVFGPVLVGQRRAQIERALRGERITFELESDMRGGKRHLQNVYIPDVRPDGSVAGIYTLSSDITAMKLVEQQLTELARVDMLTGLPNRRQLEEKLEQAVARSRRSGRAMALLFLDIDRFKQINDEHGHGVGDEVLKEFAGRLRGCVRTTDTVARLAGDEFVIVLEGLRDSDEAELVAQKIGSALHPVFGEAAGAQRVTSSIGVAFVDGQEVTPEQIIAKADKALYQAKRAGRATFALVEWSVDDLAPQTRH